MELLGLLFFYVSGASNDCALRMVEVDPDVPYPALLRGFYFAELRRTCSRIYPAPAQPFPNEGRTATHWPFPISQSTPAPTV